MSRAVLHHLTVVVICLVLGAIGGLLYSASGSARYATTARVLINPASGNPFVPAPSSVRQDELTSLETEAAVVRSEEVLGLVAEKVDSVSATVLERQVQVVVPPNTQILEITYTGDDAAMAQRVANAVATSYLDNRTLRFESVNEARIERVEGRTATVVTNLRTATAAAQTANPAIRQFQEQLATALRNELVSLRARRTALENSESPSGSVIAPAGKGVKVASLAAVGFPVGGALGGLALGCLFAVAWERGRGVVRSVHDVEASGVPVVAAVPTPRVRDRLVRRRNDDDTDTAIRRLRATLLDIEPRPDVVAIAPVGSGRSDDEISAAVAESFAKAGHRVVLVRTDSAATKDRLGVDDRGLAQVLLHERLNVLDLLQATAEPLLCLLSDGGFTAQSRELLVADRVRTVLSPLIESGQLVIIQSPGIDSAEGEAFIGAADLTVAVVRTGGTRSRALTQVAKLIRTKNRSIAALVVGRRDARRGNVAAPGENGDDSDQPQTNTHETSDEKIRARR
jgi:capsular polysaccharide biosynthesis protein